MKKNTKFPSKFLWGASTSAHQIEGNLSNDWAEWEIENAERLAAKAHDRYCLDEKLHKEAEDTQNYISGEACNHFENYEEDFKLAGKMGLKAYRLSIDWSRIEPTKGKFDLEALQHYKKMMISLKEKNIEPLVTLWHWPIPLWLKEECGWISMNIIPYFLRYVRKVTEFLQDEVKMWVTLNEPDVYASNSYGKGVWPPQDKSFLSYCRVRRCLIEAHKKAYQVIKEINPKNQVGVAKNIVHFEACGGKFWNRLLKFIGDTWWNRYFLRKTKNCHDFIGLNFYFHDRINGWFHRNKNEVRSDMGWELNPESIYCVLKMLKCYQKPIYILENGLADYQDKKRPWFISKTLQAVLKAINEGVDVRGYCHWSLMDNFEWSHGFWPRFGLIEVDFKTQKRKLRPSAKFYAEIIKTGQVQDREIIS